MPSVMPFFCRNLPAPGEDGVSGRELISMKKSVLLLLSATAFAGEPDLPFNVQNPGLLSPGKVYASKW